MTDDEMEDSSPEYSLPVEIANELNRVVNRHFDKKDREDARDLIRHSFDLLPFELQELYHEVTQLYRAGKHEEASKLFEQWIDEARNMGLI